MDAAGVVDARRERLGLGRRADETEPVPQPLHGRAAREHRPFERVAVGRGRLQETVGRRGSRRRPVWTRTKLPVPYVALPSPGAWQPCP